MNVRLPPYAYCQFCGTALPQNTDGVVRQEIRCLHCNHITYKNPLPVAVLVVPTPNRQSIFAVQRGINPGKGLMACPGGYIQSGESWREAAARETYEELKIRIRNPEHDIELITVLGASPFERLLVFGIVRHPGAMEIQPFTESEEALDRVIIGHDSRVHYAFQLHQQIIERFLHGDFAHLLASYG